METACIFVVGWLTVLYFVVFCQESAKDGFVYIRIMRQLQLVLLYQQRLLWDYMMVIFRHFARREKANKYKKFRQIRN